MWLGISAFVYFIADPIVYEFTKRTETMLDDLLLQACKLPVFMLILVYGIVSSLDILQFEPETFANIQQAYGILLILLLAWMAYRIYRDVVIYYATKMAAKTDTEIDDVLVPILDKIGMIVIPLIAILIILGEVGVKSNTATGECWCY